MEERRTVVDRYFTRIYKTGKISILVKYIPGFSLEKEALSILL